ncbi:S-methyl-5-thioadenosine phosphorylase [Microbotryomycetes sp. JL221]|nr:S-methyl-5-thioadenosine phosphorylase [Microbotryomycetes sp. JL221]
MTYDRLMDNPPLIGVIGGSGLYKLDNLTVERTIETTTVSSMFISDKAPVGSLVDKHVNGQPWGPPSSPITIASLDTPQGPVHVAFIARHSTAHSITPSNVPARANIAVLKHLGVKAIVAFSAVGSLREEIRPGDLIVPDQIIDRTKGIRPSTFFDGSMVGHAMFGDPFDTQLSQFIIPHVQNAIDSFSNHINPTDLPRLHEDKTLIVMEGPQFSTRAESNMYRQIGGDIINMSTIPEAKLAREAELSYALVCTSTDYDAWRVGHAPVTVEEVMKTLSTNAALSKHVTASILGAVHEAVQSNNLLTQTKGSMKFSLMTNHDFVSKEELYKYKYILPEYFPYDKPQDVPN